jgi:hypothetical protein
MTTYELGGKVDSSYFVSSNTSIKILEDGMFGVNPKPTDSFQYIRLYTSINGSIKIVFELDPIINERWIVTEKNIGVSGYGSTTYELVIEDSDLDFDM